METSSSDISVVLKDRRISLDMTLQELAEKTGISASHLGRLERGEHTAIGNMFQKLAQPVHFEETELFCWGGLSTAKPKPEFVPAATKGL